MKEKSRINAYANKKDIDLEDLAEKNGSTKIQTGKIEKIKNEDIKFDPDHNRSGLSAFFEEQKRLRERFKHFDIDTSAKVKQTEIKDKLKWLFDNRKL